MFHDKSVGKINIFKTVINIVSDVYQCLEDISISQPQ